LLSIAFARRSNNRVAVKLAFLSKYREGGLLLLRASIGLLLIFVAARPLMGGAARWAKFGVDVRAIGLHSHLQLWGLIAALAFCIGGVLMIFGLFFRIGVLLALFVASVRALALWNGGGGFGSALPAIETAVVLLSLLFIGPGNYSVDKT
jgi:putative oxidoreductase